MIFPAVANIATYFSPDEDTDSVFLDYIAQTKTHLRIAVYGFHLPKLTDLLIILHRKGVDVAVVCDHIQARGKAEIIEIEKLLAAGVKLVEGTSQKHKIMHHKFAVRDKTTVLSGSWNFSLSAGEESNYFDIIEHEARSDRFLQIWQEMYDWITTHEEQYQERM